MFNTLASYLLGTKSGNRGINPAEESNHQPLADNAIADEDIHFDGHHLINLTTRSCGRNNNNNNNKKNAADEDSDEADDDIDDDWLLVDKNERDIENEPICRKQRGDRKDDGEADDEQEEEDDDDDRIAHLTRIDSEENLPLVKILNRPFGAGASAGAGAVSQLHYANYDYEDNKELERLEYASIAAAAAASGIGAQTTTTTTTTTTSFYIPNSMEESWFVTPPPCFTSTGPIHMEISPFEDLLIENTSLSLCRTLRILQRLEEDVIVFHPADDRSPPIHAAARLTEAPRSERVEHSNHSNNNGGSQVVRQPAKQVILTLRAEKTQKKKARATMCRSALERANKVREVNSKGGRQKRSDLQHSKNSSRANNNRKC